jgi:hypothetical protein
MVLVPESLDDFIGEDNPVRVIDLFVDELDLQGLGFASAQPAVTPRTLPSSPGEVRLHRRPRGAVSGASPVFDDGGPSERLLRVEAATRLRALG